jgi:outer membrane protein assembly factor BamB
MRLFIVAVALVALTLPVGAVSPQFWNVDSPDEFLAGEIEGLVVTARGALRAGPQMTKLGSVTDPFVLSQAVGEGGTRYVGTGNAGKVYRLTGNELKLLYTAPEPEIYALAYAKGWLYVASSPNGKIYRVDPRTGTGTEFFDPKEAYIWSMVVMPDGSLAAGTGIDGKLYHAG